MMDPSPAVSARGRPATYPTDPLVHELIAVQAVAQPDRLAVVAPGEVLTYGDLDRRSSQLAAYLQATTGAGPEVRIGACLRRGHAAVIALLGIVRSGAAAVLTDPDTPPRRLEAMLRDAGTRAVVTAAGDSGTPADTFAAIAASGAETVRLDRAAAAVGACPPAADPRLTADNAAHVAYTSGSTGTAKGVVARHASVLQCVYWAQEAFGLSAGDRTTWVSSPAFGISLVNELWPALATGCTVYVPDVETLLFADRLRDWLLANRVTVVQLTRTLAEPLCGLRWPGADGPRLLLVTGERVEHWPPDGLPFELAVTYGSTETTHITSWTDRAAGTLMGRRLAQQPPVGWPVSNTAVYLLDPAGWPVEAGTPGEIHVAGPGLARGYLGDPALTAARWVPDPFAAVPGSRMCRTGDLGRLLPDGSLEILGRVDRQVKVRGQRVDLDEVEAVLRGRPEVDEAAVTAQRDGDCLRLVAYVSGLDSSQVSGVHAALAFLLPPYALPSDFVLLDVLPRTASGKVDRQALPAPTHGRDASAAPLRAAADDLERTLVELWRQLLCKEEVSVVDRFFDLGGHSMLAVQMVAAIEDRWGVAIDLPAFYERPTIAQVAAMLRTPGPRGSRWLVRMRGSRAASVVGLRLICFPFAGGGPSAFGAWPDLLPSVVEVCCVQPPGRGERLTEPTLSRLDDLVDQLGPTLVPEVTGRPVVFFGHSLGAIAAFEIARWLRRHGHPLPARLLVSGAASPQVPVTTAVHRLAEDELWAHARQLGGTPEELLRDPQLRQVALPALRGDFAMHETYRYRPEPPLDCPVTGFGGSEDDEVPPHQLDLWRTQTRAAFDRHVLPGGHFFLNSARDQLLGLVGDIVAPLVATGA